MKVAFFTNTFTPHVGGVARSVVAFTDELRSQGIEVLTVAPTFENMPRNEYNVVRVPAVQNFNGSDFSIAYPLNSIVRSAVDTFQPDVIHSHHPFVLGATAHCIARTIGTPLVFTHHTMYEQYTHYVPGDSSAMKQFAIQLGTSYANMCQHVIAPSESIRDTLKGRGVAKPVSVVPTGVDCANFPKGSGAGFRQIFGIPEDAFVVGHVGRLALEKNLEFLGKAIVAFLRESPTSHFILVGGGSYANTLAEGFDSAGVGDRVHAPGSLSGRFLTSAYRAMNAFAFASHSETQGMVLTEAMAAGVPVVAVDAPGVREVVKTGENGIALPKDSVPDFVNALRNLAAEPHSHLAAGCAATAEAYSIQSSTRKLINIYEQLREEQHTHDHDYHTTWERAMRLAEAEWDLLRGVAEAASTAIFEPDSE
ncbi:MAG: 1,2-diacylglycerol 3-alpha-glucosyltransferase [Verrucomicrobiales bacterium]|jgi:1,2-diacylglycerol 3-alpha-glucosyltransferase